MYAVYHEARKIRRIIIIIKKCSCKNNHNESTLLLEGLDEIYEEFQVA